MRLMRLVKGIGMCATTLVGFVLTFGCESAPETQQPITVSWKTPEFSFTPGTDAEQRRDDVIMTLLPYPYKAEDKMDIEDRERPPDFGETFADAGKKPEERSQYFTRRQVPRVVVVPESLAFQLKVNNNLERTLRLAGSTVRFKINGKSVPVPQTNYADLLAAVVVPREELDFPVYGPALTDIPMSANLIFQIFDVPTDVNQAGVVQKKTNFEWVLKYRMDEHSKQAPVTETKMVQRRR